MTKKLKRRLKALMEFGLGSYVGGEEYTSGTSTAKKTYVKCHGTHTGETPILIGGKEVRLGACFYITPAAIAASQVLLPLNGKMPSKMPFGVGKYVVECELADRGGVPESWGEFIDYVASLMEKYKVMGWCMGSHGRTGVLGASLIAKLEPEVEDPIAEIRLRHCPHAVESLKQATAVFAIKGLELPEKYKDEFKENSYSYAAAGGTYFPKGWYLGKEYTHDLGDCTCDACAADFAKDGKRGTTKRTYPCTCSRFKMCIDDRLEWKESAAKREAAAKAPPKANLSLVGKCRNDTACFCDKCQKDDVQPGEHDLVKPATCCCAECILIYKITIRKEWDFLHKQSGHIGECLCEECWYTCQGHATKCSCRDCIKLNLEPPELEKSAASVATSDEGAPNFSKWDATWKCYLCTNCGMAVPDTCHCALAKFRNGTAEPEGAPPPNSVWNGQWKMYRCLGCQLGIKYCKCESRREGAIDSAGGAAV